jgi:uncharacterized protein (TIGR00369 family)
MGAEEEKLVRGFIGGSPLARLLGVEVVSVEPDEVRMRLPFRPEITTIGDLVHGGAIAALIDTAATAAAWSGVDPASGVRGTTVGFSVNFLSGARGHDVTATARVIRRGRSITVCEVGVAAEDSDEVARALVTYKLGG